MHLKIGTKVVILVNICKQNAHFQNQNITLLAIYQCKKGKKSPCSRRKGLLHGR